MPLTADRVRETSVSLGTGNLTLDGPATGFRSFDTAFGIGPTFWYAVAAVGGAEWEVGVGQLSASSTLQRSSVLASSNGGSAVAFGAGTKDVFATVPGSALNELANKIAVVYASLPLVAGPSGKRQALGATTELRFTAVSAGTIHIRFSDASAAIAVNGGDTVVDVFAGTPVRLPVPSAQPFIEYLRVGGSDVNFTLALMR